MSDRMLHVALYMESQPLTEEWLHTLLFRLWERGLHFHYDYANAPLTWDEELNVLAHGVAGNEVYDVQLSTLIQHIVTGGIGLITVYDKRMALKLFVDPSGIPDDFEVDDVDEPYEIPKRFGQVGIVINGPYLDTKPELPLSRELPAGAYQLAPYQQIMLAGAHWMEVLCDECHPIFGVGYDTNRESAEEDEREVIEAPLYEGRLPDQTAWRSLMYISKRFIDDEFVLYRLASPGCWIRRTRDEGIFMHTPYKEYAYENAEAYRQAHEGKAAMKEHAFARAVYHYKRAMGIFRSVSNDSEVWQCERDIADVDLERRREEERKGVVSRENVLG